MQYLIRSISYLALLILPVAMAWAGDEDNSWRFESGSVQLEIDAQATGQITHWSVNGHQVVDTSNPSSPLQMTDGDGVQWSFAADSYSETSSTGGPILQINGALTPDNDNTARVLASLSYGLIDGGRKINVMIESPEAPQMILRNYGWHLPLGLQPRKRVFYMSDYALKWETRYFYQLLIEPRSGPDVVAWGLLQIPDRNIWRYFSLDQLGPDAYRLWKASEDGNAPLTMHQGKSPAPAVQVYDQHAGIDVEYPGLRTQAPKSLRVDASKGSSVEVQFWPSFCAPTEARRTNAFARHELVLTAHASEKEALQAQTDWHARYADGFPQKPDPATILSEAEWVVTAPNGSTRQSVTGGYPFAKGELQDTAAIQVIVADQPVAVQARPLAYWPDGSVKWAQLTFTADTSHAVADCSPPRVSLRTGLHIPVSVTINPRNTPIASASKIRVQTLDDGGLTIVTGGLQAELGTGSNWLRRVSLHGKTIIDTPNGSSNAYTNYLRDPTEVFPFDQSPTGGQIDPGHLIVESIQIEETGPLRAIVRLEGLTTNKEPTRIVLRLEFLAGKDEIRLTHTAVFRYQDARKTFLTGMGLEFPLSQEDPAHDSEHSSKLLQLSTQMRSLFVDDVAQTEDSAHNGWLRSQGVSATLRNFKEMAPMALSVGPDKLAMELWPTGIYPMDTRRYSDFLHLAQLESGAPMPADTWTQNHYYPNGSFYGISCTHEMLLAFGTDNQATSGETQAADFQSPPLLYAGWDRYAETGVVMTQANAESWPRMWAAWTNLTRFFLYHRELHDWQGLWTFGDFQHRFQGGFGWIVDPATLAQMPKDSVREKRQMDNAPTNDWGYDNGAYGWTNTEGLPNLFLQHEYLRHGNRATYFASEAMARHSRDVIVRQEGPLLGRGTRHGVQPWSGGNHEERQTSATEYRLHYYLSGDARTRDVIENLYEKVYTKGTVKQAASHGGRLGGLLFHWELTGDPKEGDRLANYVSRFVADNGIYTAPLVAFPDASQISAPRGLNDGGLFFQTFGAMHALVEYEALTGDPALSKAIIAMASTIIQRPIIEEGRLGEGDYSWGPVAFAALHAKDPAPYQAFLNRYIESYGWRSAYQPVTFEPNHWSGPTGLMTKTVALGFFWANWAPYVGAALPEGEMWSPEINAKFQSFETNGNPHKAGRPSWQSQFDSIPAAEAYLGPQQPWKTSE